MYLNATVDLLKSLIQTPSLSGEEHQTADLLQDYLHQKGILVTRKFNNLWAKNAFWSSDKPTLLLNSHHDTVKPVDSWSISPFTPLSRDGKLYGLGANDAGASLVSLIQVFLHFYADETLPFNLLLVASAEEEISGKRGISAVLPHLPKIDFGIVGEPTNLKMAVAEKGLMVIDALVKGQSGHAARKEGINAIYKAQSDIQRLEQFQFPKQSAWLGPTLAQITQIEAGYQHNVVPDACRYVIDVRTTDQYPNQEAFQMLAALLEAELTARSFRLNPSGLAETHVLFKAGKALGLEAYGSPTLSDQALMPFPTVKLGPGKSERSHTADEFIKVQEIEDGIHTYIQYIECLQNQLQYSRSENALQTGTPKNWHV
ncbi:MAG: M20 family metallo-hydrolase [Bacteroidota bacterium]